MMLQLAQRILGLVDFSGISEDYVPEKSKYTEPKVGFHQLPGKCCVQLSESSKVPRRWALLVPF